MADMELVIKIDEEVYKKAKETHDVMCDSVWLGIKYGTPLSKGHGDLIDRKLVLSDDGLCEFHRYDDYVKMRNYLKSIPTIIEADGGNENECHY